MDGVNKRTLSKLGATAELPVINFEDHEIVTLFDTPHLLKCFRNMFLKYDIECPVSTPDNGTGKTELICTDIIKLKSLFV